MTDQYELAERLAEHNRQHPDRVSDCPVCYILTWRFLKRHYDPARFAGDLELHWPPLWWQRWRWRKRAAERVPEQRRGEETR